MDGHNAFDLEAKREALRAYQHHGAAAYLTAYIGLMMDSLEVNETSEAGLKAMVLAMLEPLNLATEAIWRALMSDKEWEAAIDRLKAALVDI